MFSRNLSDSSPCIVRTRTRISQGVYGSQFFAGRFLCVNRVSHFLRQIPVQWQIFIFISRLWRTISFKLCWTACNMHNRLRIHCWSIGERRSTNSSSLCLSLHWRQFSHQQWQWRGRKKFSRLIMPTSSKTAFIFKARGQIKSHKRFPGNFK